MFSVIIPLYNKAPYIEKALRSIQAQTFREFEVIVIDDGSTDNSLEVANRTIAEISTNRTMTQPLGGWRVYSQKNAGVSMARNNGVALSSPPCGGIKGGYLCFLDADDWWTPTFLEEMKALIEEFPDAGIYGTSYFKVKNGQNIPANIGVPDGFEKGEINYCQVYAKTLWMPLTSISICIPKTVFESENGFKPQLKLGEDFDLWVRIAMKYPVVFLNKPQAYYNQDVDAKNRAVGMKFYKPEEHMLFTDYGELMRDEDFRYLFEKLALYGLLPYYLNNKNRCEILQILNRIEWSNHESKYRIYYRLIPKCVLKNFFSLLRFGSIVKSKIKQ